MYGEKSKATWIKEENPAISNFYDKLYKFIFKNYLMSLYNRYNEIDAKGQNSNWLELCNKKIGLTGKGISIILKFNQQETGIELRGMGTHIEELKHKFSDVIEPMFDDGAFLESRGKSAYLFYKINKVDVEREFDDQIENIDDALKKTEKLLRCFWRLRDTYNMTSSPFEI